jgi:hypothetical protein
LQITADEVVKSFPNKGEVVNSKAVQEENETIAEESK